MEARDPRDIAAYGLSEAAAYLQLPPATLRAWAMGRTISSQAGRRFIPPIIELPDPASAQLSFTNLVEAHVLAALRRQDRVRLGNIRDAVQYAANVHGQPHPLARATFMTDGVDLFVTHLGELVNASRSGQLAMREVIELHLRRVECDAHGLAMRLYPFTRPVAADTPRFVVIDPRISFGRPSIVGTGVPTDVVIDRYRAGESVDELADDTGCDRAMIEEVIRGAIQHAA